MTITANPTKNPIFVHLAALLLASTASSYLPAAYNELTFAAKTIPAIPNGKQQKNGYENGFGHPRFRTRLSFHKINI